MTVHSSRPAIDRTSFRAVDWDDHVASHDASLREYWLSQPIAARLAGALRCRRRVQGVLPPVDRTHFRLVELTDLDN